MRMLLNLPLLAAVICGLQSSVQSRALPDSSIEQNQGSCQGPKCPRELFHIHSQYDQDKNQALDLRFSQQSIGNLLPQESSQPKDLMMIHHLAGEIMEETQMTLPQIQVIQIMLQHTLAPVTLQRPQTPRTLRYISALQIPTILLHHHPVLTML